MRPRLFHSFVIALGCVLAGCGGDDGPSGGTADAGPGDPEEPDASSEPAEGPCAVERIGPSATVVFHDPSGQPLATAQTDGDGVARHDACVDGGMVTIVNPLFLGGGSFSRIVTVQGVKVGDTVRFDPPAAPAEPVGPLTIAVANKEDDVSVEPDHYVVNLGDCMGAPAPLDGDTGGQVEIEDLDDCLGHDRSDYAVVSMALSAGDELRGLARIDSSDLIPPIAVSGGTWVPYGGPALLALENAPAAATSGFLVVSPLIDGVIYYRFTRAFDPQGETVDAGYWPEAIADAHRLAISVKWPDTSTSMTILRTSSEPTALDLADLLFEGIDSPVLDVTDPLRPRYQWQGGDPRAAITRAEIHWTGDDHAGQWIVVAPGNPGAAALPVLPDALASQGPRESSAIYLGPLLLIDRGIDYATWLESGLSTISYGDAILPELGHSEEESILRALIFDPDPPA